MVVVAVLLRRYKELRPGVWSSAVEVKLRAVQVQGTRALPDVEGGETCRSSCLLRR